MLHPTVCPGFPRWLSSIVIHLTHTHTHTHTSLGLPQHCKVQKTPAWVGPEVFSANSFKTTCGQAIQAGDIFNPSMLRVSIALALSSLGIALLSSCHTSALYIYTSDRLAPKTQMSPRSSQVVVLFIESIECAIKPGIYSSIVLDKDTIRFTSFTPKYKLMCAAVTRTSRGKKGTNKFTRSYTKWEGIITTGTRNVITIQHHCQRKRNQSGVTKTFRLL